MSYAGSGGDDQSEDGELRHSPADPKSRQEEILDFSLSDEDADTADSLDIKPPQASSRLPRSSGKGRRRDRREGRSRHSRTDRHREERSHGHRDKHHRERTRERTRTDYREYQHKDMYRYQEGHGSASQQMVGKYLEHPYRRQDELVALAAQSIRYERRERDRHEKHEMRYVQEQEKTRRYEEKERRLKSAADQTLDDLRERLLDKKRLKDATDDKEPKRRHRSSEHQDLSSLEQDAEMYVQEIIDLSGEEKKLTNKHEEDLEPMEILTKEEDEEQEMRKEKLLQADRERARQKEQYKLERERRHQRRLERQEAKRKMQEEQMKEEKRKKQRISGELSIVTVSDASSVESSRSNSPISGDSRASSTSRSSSTEEEQEIEVENQPESSHSQSSVISNQKPTLEPSPVAPVEPSSPSNHSSRSPSPTNPTKIQQAATTPAPKTPETIKVIDVSLPPYLPAIQGCRSVEEFQCLNRIEEGTYGVVYRAKDKRTDEIVALKRLKMEKEKEGFPITSLREINTLLKGQHPNIVTVREIVVGSNMDKIFIVMDYVEHDLKSLMETMRNRRQVFVPGEVKCLLKQLLGAVAHLHDNWILHRDLKTSNLLLSHKGILKVGDFGLAREYGSPLKPYTPIVVTLWYRAPELLLCAKEYSTPVDMWSVGCIFAELLLMNALFPGKSEIDQLNRIFKELGTPNDRVWPSWSSLPAVKKMKFTEYPGTSLPQKFSMLSECGLGLLKRLLTYDPTKRSTAEDGARHPWFSEAPLPIHPDMFPTWPAKSELGHRKALAASPKPPSGGKEYKQLGDGDEDSALGFHMGSSGASSSLMEARRLGMGAGFSLRF